MTKNTEKIILDLYGGTGSWSKPWSDAGYMVYVITLPDYDMRLTTIGDEHVTFRGEKGNLSIPLTAVVGILAAPPCTHFSFARTRAKTPRDMRGGMELVEKALQIVWACRQTGTLKWWALENPTGYLRQFLGVPGFSFKQWQYGGVADKPTDIWGYFTPPGKTHRKRPKSAINHNNDPRWTHPTVPEEMRHMGVRAARAAIRAITPPGFAKAFYKANQASS